MDKKRWILCSNRLPPKAKIVLVTDGIGVGLGFMGLHGTKRSRKDPIFFRPVKLDHIENVIAWQHLPKPLKLRKRIEKIEVLKDVE